MSIIGDAIDQINQVNQICDDLEAEFSLVETRAITDKLRLAIEAAFPGAGFLETIQRAQIVAVEDPAQMFAVTSLDDRLFVVRTQNGDPMSESEIYRRIFGVTAHQLVAARRRRALRVPT